jgi:uracil-DNA glycosylase family 4
MENLSKQDTDKINKRLFNKMSECRLCPHVNHSQIYPGIYRPGQKYFFVGAAPWNLAGEQEAFRVGAAAANFERYIAANGITRDECFTTNAVVHIPVTGKARQPDSYEIKRCSQYLEQYIDILKPKLVIALGAVALEALNGIFMSSFKRVKDNFRRAVPWNGRYLMICTHPSPMAVSFRGDVEQIKDYKAVKEFYDQLTRRD